MVIIYVRHYIKKDTRFSAFFCGFYGFNRDRGPGLVDMVVDWVVVFSLVWFGLVQLG